MMEWEAQRIEASDGYGDERPDPGDGDDRCKHGFVVYGEGDCDLCDEENEDDRFEYDRRHVEVESDPSDVDARPVESDDEDDPEILTSAQEASLSYLLAEYDEARLRLREHRVREAFPGQLFYLVEAEGITLCQIRRDIRDLGVDTTDTLR